MWADEHPPRVTEAEWVQARVLLLSCVDDRREIGTKMQKAENAYITEDADNTGMCGRQFAELAAAYLNGESLKSIAKKEDGTRVDLYARIGALKDRLGNRNFYPGRQFDGSALTAFKTLQNKGNEACHVGAFGHANKPVVIDAMYTLARFLEPDTIFRVSAGSSSLSVFEDVLVEMFKEFMITEDTQRVLSAQGTCYRSHEVLIGLYISSMSLHILTLTHHAYTPPWTSTTLSTYLSMKATNTWQASWMKHRLMTLNCSVYHLLLLSASLREVCPGAKNSFWAKKKKKQQQQQQ